MDGLILPCESCRTCLDYTRERLGMPFDLLRRRLSLVSDIPEEAVDTPSSSGLCSDERVQG